MSVVVALLAAVVAVSGFTLMLLALALDERRYDPNRPSMALILGLLVSGMVFMSGGWLLTQQPGDNGTDADRVVLGGTEQAPVEEEDRDEAGDEVVDDDGMGSASPEGGAGPPPPPVRIPQGSDVEVAAALSRARYADGGAAHVLLIRSGPSVDALVASGLHGLLDGPVLLTESGELPPETVEEIDRMETPAVHILGGEMAVTAQVEAELVAAGHDVHRHSGARGIDTAIGIAERHFPDAETAIIAPAFSAGSAWRSAGVLAAGSLAAARGLPVLLSDSDGLTEATADHLGRSAIRTVIVVGGEEEWRAPVKQDLAALGISVVSLEGPDRFGTAAAVARLNDPDEGEVAPVFLLEGSSDAMWPGAIVAFTRGGWDLARILLSDGDELPQASRDAIDAQRETDEPVRCLQGVDESVCAEARALGS